MKNNVEAIDHAEIRLLKMDAVGNRLHSGDEAEKLHNNVITVEGTGTNFFDHSGQERSSGLFKGDKNVKENNDTKEVNLTDQHKNEEENQGM